MKLLRWADTGNTYTIQGYQGVERKLQYNSGEGWKDYTQHPLSKPDWAFSTKGYATMQLLLRMGYVFEKFSE
jgi:hypothetical protein